MVWCFAGMHNLLYILHRWYCCVHLCILCLLVFTQHSQRKNLILPYCPGQAPMYARSSSTKNWGWAVVWRRCLNGSTIPVQGPIPNAKSAARGYRIDLHCCFVCALLRPAWQGRKLYCATKWTDSLPHCQVSTAIQFSLAVREFHAAGKEQCNKATDGCVRTFDAWCHGTQSASEQSQLLSEPTFGSTLS